MRTAVDTLTYNEKEIRRIAVKAFDIAMKRKMCIRDSCKETPDAEQLRILSDFGIMLTSVEKKEPKLHHAW